jgi:hypothetical protein
MRAARGVVAGFAIALAIPAQAAARPPQRAVKAALRTLKPTKLPGQVVVFAARVAVKRGGHVGPAFASAPGQTSAATLRAKRRSWLFWEDEAYSTAFEHPSIALLVDVRSNKPAGRIALTMPPVVDGRPPPFIATPAGYHDRRLMVYAGKHPPKAHVRATQHPVALPRATPAMFPGDCLIEIGDRFAAGQQGPLKGRSLLDGSFKAMEHWADSVGLPRSVASTSEDLANEVNAHIAAGCNDVFIFIAGHGVPPPGITDTSGAQLRGGPAGVHLGGRLVGFAKNGSEILKDDWIRPDDLGHIVSDHPTIEFKFKIESCFSGRFTTDALDDGTTLPQHENVRVIETSSSDREFSQAQMFDTFIDRRTKQVVKVEKVTKDNPYDAGEFTNGDVHGLEMWVASPTEQQEHPGLAGAIARSSTLGAAFDGAQSRGKTHPIVTENPPLQVPLGSGEPSRLPPNQPPVAAFTFAPNDPPTGPKAGQTVTFDGSSSSDPDGHVTGWAWSFGGAGVQATNAFPNPGIYPVTVTVTDDRGGTAQVTHEVKVSGPGTKSDTLSAGDLCGADGYTDLYVPSYAQNVRIEVATSDCTSFTVGTQGLIAGNPDGRLDEWGQPKDTYHVNWHTGGSGSGSVTITVQWD